MSGLVISLTHSVDDIDRCSIAMEVDGAWWHPVAVTDDDLKVADQPLPLSRALDVMRDVLAVQDADAVEGREVFRRT